MTARLLSAGLMLATLAACAAPTSPASIAKPLGAYRAGEIMVAWAPGATADQQQAVLTRYGLSVIAGAGQTCQLLGVAQGQELTTIQQLKGETAVAVAEPDYVKHTQEVGPIRPLRRVQMTPNDPAWVDTSGQPAQSPQVGQLAMWGLRAIKADTAWDTTAGAPSVIVATIDTGADMNHPDLRANLDAQDAKNLVEEGNPVDDDYGHGTHVAGIIAAVGNNAAGVIGVAWRARVLPIRVLGVDGSGSAYNTVEALQYAVQAGAKVVNMSLGSPDHSDIEADAISQAIAAGVVVVAAAGNEATDGNYEEYPASYPGVISVGAIGPDLKRAWFSNYNSHVTVSAPGVDILSTIPSRFGPSPYGYMSGTSMAAPMVSGVAALILSVHPGWSPARVTQQLVATAQPESANSTDPAGYNEFFGAGLVDASQAVTR